ncbi:hypothetical protein [Streptomyces hokutonensis]|uniref:hypothetical protein n=1 Tax=Streptomyces hokutonensis TaxID=1306990 RepID=UPI0038128D47
MSQPEPGTLPQRTFDGRTEFVQGGQGQLAGPGIPVADLGGLGVEPGTCDDIVGTVPGGLGCDHHTARDVRVVRGPGAPRCTFPTARRGSAGAAPIVGGERPLQAHGLGRREELPQQLLELDTDGLSFEYAHHIDQ